MAAEDGLGVDEGADSGYIARNRMKTGNSKSKRRDHTEGWGSAVRDAQQEIDHAKQRIKRLRESIRVFKKRLVNGDLWPGEDRVQSGGDKPVR